MVPVSDLEMAVNSTYSSILNEVQLSNLNYSIHMTPFAAYITLKKSVQKDLSGTPAVPSPPLLFLLDSAQQENLELRQENLQLKTACEMQQGNLDNIVQEKVCLENTIEEKEINVKALNTTMVPGTNL